MEENWSLRLYRVTGYCHAELDVSGPAEGLLYVKIINMLFDVAREQDLGFDTVVNRYQFADKRGMVAMLMHFDKCEIYLYFNEIRVASVHPDIIEWVLEP
jgi:hypothetical protein